MTWRPVRSAQALSSLATFGEVVVAADHQAGSHRGRRGRHDFDAIGGGHGPVDGDEQFDRATLATGLVDDADGWFRRPGVVTLDVGLDLDEERRQVRSRRHLGSQRSPAAGWASPHHHIEISGALEADLQIGEAMLECQSLLLPVRIVDVPAHRSGSGRRSAGP